MDAESFTSQLYMTKNDKYFTFIFNILKKQQRAHISQLPFSKYDNKTVIKYDLYH